GTARSGGVARRSGTGGVALRSMTPPWQQSVAGNRALVTEAPCPGGTWDRPTPRRQRGLPRSPTREPVFPTESAEAPMDFHTSGRTPAGTPGAQGRSPHGRVRAAVGARADGATRSGFRGGRDGGGGGGEPGPWRGGNASGWTEEGVQPEAEPRGRAPFGDRGGLGRRRV